MRRPNSLRYNNWMGECVKYLQTSPAVLPSDRNLVAWVQLLKISEEIAVAFSFEDMNNIASLSDHQTQLMLKLYEERLNQWRRHMDSRIMIGEYIVRQSRIQTYRITQVPWQSCTTTCLYIFMRLHCMVNTALRASNRPISSRTSIRIKERTAVL